MARFRIRDMSGVLKTNWDVCTVLERKTWCGWRQVKECHADIYSYQSKEKIQAQHIEELTELMKFELTDRVLFDTASVSHRESEAQKLLER